MNKEEILAGNELIAKFMGLLPIENKYHKGYYQLSKHRGNVWYHNPLDVYNKCEYHSSWDWLMPVVDKVENLGYYVNISLYTTGGSNKEFGCQITKYNKETYRYENLPLKLTFGKTKIEEVYLQMIEFIKWYNKRK